MTTTKYINKKMRNGNETGMEIVGELSRDNCNGVDDNKDSNTNKDLNCDYDKINNIIDSLNEVEKKELIKMLIG
jgi:hypothetical protein